MQLSDFRVNLPYPEVTGKVDAKTLTELYEVYAGRFSEMTAITSYSYQDFILSEREPCLSKIIEEISIVEMTHLELLGKAILALGGDPIFVGRYNYFATSYTNYNKGVAEILKTNILGERRAVEDYNSLADFTDNKSLAQLIKRIIMDEEIHITLFENALAEYELKGKVICERGISDD